MNRECRKMRADMERSAFKPLPRERQDEIDKHVVHCAACREYLEAMRGDERTLTDFARSFEPSIDRIEKESIRAAACGAATEPDENAQAWREIMKSKIAVYAAAAIALVAVLWGLNRFTGVFRGEPAFADVMARVNKAESVTYRQQLKFEGADPSAAENMATDTGLLRTTFEEIVIVRDFNKGIMLNMSPSTKRAFLERQVGLKRGKGLFNYVDWIATLQNGPSGRFVGREKIDGIEANAFVIENGEFQTIRIWADPNTNLPLRIVWTNSHNPKLDVVEPTMTLYESDFGGEVGITRMIILSSSDGLQRNSEWVYEDFKWNEKFDPTLFSLTPPNDYVVRESQLDVSSWKEKDLIDALSAWAEMSQKSFPAQIADLTSVEEVRSILIRRYDKNGEPGKELEAAMGAAQLLLKGLAFSQNMKASGDWHYAGAGVKLGDKKAPVCWWKPEGSQKYRILYGDLRVVDIDKADLPKASR
jgi:outer membrane lipoprotein-sorting protein